MKVRVLSTRDAGFDAAFAQLVSVDTAADRRIDAAAAAIVDDVRRRGDAALLEYSNRFDRTAAPSVAALEIPAEDMRAALEALPVGDRAALEAAARRIQSFHDRQRSESWSVVEDDGTELRPAGDAAGQRRRLRAGRAGGLPVVGADERDPAQVAGVRDIVMVSPTPDGARNPLVLAAAALAGVTRAFAIGGAQAVAALAHGTERCRRSTRSSARAMPTSPRPSGTCSARSAST